MSRTSRFISGVGLGYTYQAAVMAVGLVLTPFLLRRLGQHEYGFWVVGMQLTGYLLLMDFGVLILLPRQIAQARGGQSSEAGARVIRNLIAEVGWVILSLTPVTIGLAGLWFILAPAEWSSLRGPIAAAGVAFGVTFPLRIFRPVLLGMQELAAAGRIQIAAWAAGTAVLVGAVLGGLGLYAFALGWTVTQLIAEGSCAWVVKSRYPDLIPWPLGKPHLGAMASHLSRGFWVMLGQVAYALTYGADLVIIGRIFGPAAVVPYSSTGKLASVLINQPQLFMHTAVPGLSEMKTAASLQKRLEVCMALALGMLVLSGACICVILSVNRAFVSWWVGPEQYSGFTLTALVLLHLLARHADAGYATALFCFGYERRITVKAFGDGLVSVAVSILGARRFGPVGAALGPLAGVCLVSLPITYFTLARELGAAPRSLAAAVWPWFWRFAIAASFAAWIPGLWAAESFAAIAAIALVALLAYAACCLPVVLRPPLAIYVRPRMVTAISLSGRIFHRQNRCPAVTSLPANTRPSPEA